ncbi:hypothetical protein SAMN05192544_10201 [Paraburkholderia hospita]|nr:hypothetical protein SAMN05192544_10201 [Paraburkholderia hospita]
MRLRGGLVVAFALVLRGAGDAGWGCWLFFAGIRVLPSCFKRRPCAFAFSLASAL